MSSKIYSSSHSQQHVSATQKNRDTSQNRTKTKTDQAATIITTPHQPTNTSSLREKIVLFINSNEGIGTPGKSNILMALIDLIFYSRVPTLDSESKLNSRIKIARSLLLLSNSTVSILKHFFSIGQRVTQLSGYAGIISVLLESFLEIRNFIFQENFEKLPIFDIQHLFKLQEIDDPAILQRLLQTFIAKIEHSQSTYTSNLSPEQTEDFAQFLQQLKNLQQAPLNQLSLDDMKNQLQELIPMGLFFSLKVFQNHFFTLSSQEREKIRNLEQELHDNPHFNEDRIGRKIHKITERMMQRKIDAIARYTGKWFVENYLQSAIKIVDQLDPRRFAILSPEEKTQTMQKAQQVITKTLEQSHKKKLIHIVSLAIFCTILTSFVLSGGASLIGSVGLYFLLTTLAGHFVRAMMITGWFNNSENKFSFKRVFETYTHSFLEFFRIRSKTAIIIPIENLA